MMVKIRGVVAVAVLAIIMALLGANIVSTKKGITNPEEIIAEGDQSEEPDVVKVEEKGMTIAIDPGHGGYDPGKVGINGALEKDVNLEISLMVEEKLQLLGYEVIMTREEDVQVQSVEESFSKTKDLDARVQILNQEGVDVAISIHQNSYTTEDVKGAQVFYYTSSQEGESIAAVMQESLREVDKDNHRQIKGNDSYYLLKRTTPPIIIVECGFLSNMTEANKLISQNYQKEMAEAIVKGIENYLESL